MIAPEQGTVNDGMIEPSLRLFTLILFRRAPNANEWGAQLDISTAGDMFLSK